MQSNMTQETHDQDSIFNAGKTCSVSIVEMQSGPSKQDIVRTGTRVDGSQWIMVADGHGNNTVTDALRGQNWDEVMNMEDHFQYIEPFYDIRDPLPVKRKSLLHFYLRFEEFSSLTSLPYFYLKTEPFHPE